MLVGFVITVILLLFICAYSSGPRMSPMRYSVILSCLAIVVVIGASLFWDIKVESMHVLLGVAIMVGINLLIYFFQYFRMSKHDED